MGQESLDRLLKKQRTLEEAVSDLTLLKSQLSNNLSVIQQKGIICLILVTDLVPIKIIATLIEERVIFVQIKEAEDLYSTIDRRRTDIKQAKSLKAIFRASADCIKEDLIVFLEKKATSVAYDLISVINVFHGLATDTTDLMEEMAGHSELTETINEQREIEVSTKTNRSIYYSTERFTH